MYWPKVSNTKREEIEYLKERSQIGSRAISIRQSPVPGKVYLGPTGISTSVNSPHVGRTAKH